MSNTVIDLEGSKQLLSHLFEMEVRKITETIRRESGDDKDKLILQLEFEIEKLKGENKKILEKFDDVRRVVNK